MATNPRPRRSSLETGQGPTHRPSVWAGVISIFLLLLITAIRFLGDELYAYPPNPPTDQLPKNAVIVCLAGGKFRIQAALSLFSQGVGDRLLIVGTGKKTTPESLARAHAVETKETIPNHRFGQIEVETESRNTIENAFAVRRYLQKNPEVQNLLLITSGYHMRRAEIMIANQISPEVKIIPFVPPNEALVKQNWWHSWIGIQVTTVEYFKFLLGSLLIPRLGYF